MCQVRSSVVLTEDSQVGRQLPRSWPLCPRHGPGGSPPSEDDLPLQPYGVPFPHPIKDTAIHTISMLLQRRQQSQRNKKKQSDRIHACMYVCMYVYMFVCICIFAYVCIYICMHGIYTVNINVRMYMYVLLSVQDRVDSTDTSRYLKPGQVDMYIIHDVTLT